MTLRLFPVFFCHLISSRGCPVGWRESPSKHCYKLLDVQVTFFTCQQQCQSHGGALACIRDRADNEFLKGLVGNSTMKVFFGFTDKTAEGRWQWITKNCSSAFRDWPSDEPNNYGSGEDCA